MNDDSQDPSTKGDLQELRTEFFGMMNEIKADLSDEMHDVKDRLGLSE